MQGSLAKLFARVNNSFQIRIPRNRNVEIGTRRRLLLVFGERRFRFVFLDAEDANRVIGFHSKEPLTLRMLYLIRPGDVLLDVGASIGIYSIPAASRVGDTGRVIAIEADHGKVRKLARNVELNQLQDRISVESVRAGAIFNAELGERTLDSVVAEARYPMPTIIKIDVDGPELSVLKGLRSTIKSSTQLRLLQVEFANSDEELIEYLRELGFKLVDFETYRDPGLFEGRSVVGNGWFVRAR